MTSKDKVAISSKRSGNDLPAFGNTKSWQTWFSMAAMAIFAVAAWPLLVGQIRAPEEKPNSANADSLPRPAYLIATASPSPTPLIPLIATPIPEPETQKEESKKQELLISMSESGEEHLFALNIETLSLTRLSTGAWNDRDANISPNGSRVAFASNRSGQWDLYSLELSKGKAKAFSDDLQYDGAPSWSSDGKWLAFERYENDNLDIYMRPLAAKGENTRITTYEGVDHSPSWSPKNPEIAFVSDRSGKNQIWVVKLEMSGDDRFQQISQAQNPVQKDPSWSPNGRYLAWSAFVDGKWRIFVFDMRRANDAPREIGAGEQPAWDREGASIAVVIRSAHENYIGVYDLDGKVQLSPLAVPGNINGISFRLELQDPMPDLFQKAASKKTTNWNRGSASADEEMELTDLIDVQAPYPQLIEGAITSFSALRERLANELGWDVFASLDHAFTPLNIPQAPGNGENWQFTGRALALPEKLPFSKWMEVVAEEYNGQTYWRVFLKAANQDGSAGQVLVNPGWDFEARFSSGNDDKQEGGKLKDHVASGYWLDISAIAQDFGWERLEALSNWRSYYQGTRFNIFIFQEDLSWRAAMLQLYSAEYLADQLNADD